MITLFDTHFHFDGTVSAQEFCASLPVEYQFLLLAQASDYASSRLAQEFAETTKNSYFTSGVHPHEAENFCATMPDFKEFRHHPKLKAIGEIGLDFFYDHSPVEAQIKTFQYFLDLARVWNLPAVIHLRDKDGEFNCYDTAYRMISDFVAQNGRFVIHCFSATPDWAEKFLELGGYLGMTGMVTFNRSINIRETLHVIPLARLLLETDSPYLAPVPFRGKPNHPKYLVNIAEYVAKEKSTSLENLAHITTENGRKLFNIS